MVGLGRMFDKLRKATAEDFTLSMALEYTRSGWRQYKDDVKLAARELCSLKDDLCVFDGLLVRGNRIVIPHSPKKKTSLAGIITGTRAP